MANSKRIINSVLALRILTLLLLTASIVVMVLNNYNLSDGTKKSFSHLHAYRYIVAVAGVGFLYTLIQIPFATYHSFTEKRLIRNGCVPYFDFYGDKLISYLLASAVGVGFGVTLEFKRCLNRVFDTLEESDVTGIDEARSKSSKFFDKGLISSGILLGDSLSWLDLHTHLSESFFFYF